MALPARSSVTGTGQSAGYLIPILGMGINPQSRAGTVAGNADIPIGMTGLTGRQILACLARMAAAPVVRGKHRVGMAGLALAFVVKAML